METDPRRNQDRIETKQAELRQNEPDLRQNGNRIEREPRQN